MNSARFAIANKSLAALAALVLLQPACSTTPKAVPVPGGAGESIVWPSPPDPPRLKFIETLRSNKDVEGRTKRNLKEILLGIEPDRLAVTLQQPMDITTDSLGRILVTDAKSKGVHVYDRTNHKFQLYGVSGNGALAWPIGIDVDGEDRIYVADHGQKKVLKYDRDGTFMSAFGEFENPVGLAVDRGRKRLFVVDSKAHAVKVMDLDGRPLDAIGERGAAEGQFNYPTYCAVDDAGSLYVTDTGNARVQIFDAGFEAVGSFGTIGVHPGQFTRPKGITVDKRGIIYVVDGAFSNFQIFDAELRLLMPVGDHGSEPGRFILPTGIHEDGAGTLIVADFGNARIQIFQLMADDLDREPPLKKN